MSTTDPPVGSSFAFRHDDPAGENEAERAEGHLDTADPLGEEQRDLHGTPRDLAEKAEEIVVREQGVNSFAHANEVDRMERPLSVNDDPRAPDDPDYAEPFVPPPPREINTTQP